jgi:hypothetical protein
MASIYFLYDTEALPSAANRGAETAGNWTDDSDTHTYSRSTDFARTGSYSHKVVAGGAGSVSQGYAYLPSANNVTFVVGTTYALTIWVHSVAGVTITFKTGGVTSSAYTPTTSGFEPITFVFTALTATTDLQVWATSADTFYMDDLLVTKCLEFATPKSVKGFDEPDEVEFFPGDAQFDYLDGSVEDTLIAFRRVITVDLGVVQVSATRKALLAWMLDNDRMLNYGVEAYITVALGDPSGYRNSWLNNMIYGRSFSFTLRETSTRTSFPT